jgi:hypothetical protein
MNRSGSLLAGSASRDSRKISPGASGGGLRVEVGDYSPCHIRPLQAAVALGRARTIAFGVGMPRGNLQQDLTTELLALRSESQPKCGEGIGHDRHATPSASIGFCTRPRAADLVGYLRPNGSRSCPRSRLSWFRRKDRARPSADLRRAYWRNSSHKVSPLRLVRPNGPHLTLRRSSRNMRHGSAEEGRQLANAK